MCDFIWVMYTMKLPIEVLLEVYKFCDIDTRLKLGKLGITRRIKLPVQSLRIQKPKKIKIPRLQMLTHKADIHYIENKRYMLMYTNIHKRGPWSVEFFSVQLLNRLGWVKKKWQLDEDLNIWSEYKN